MTVESTIHRDSRIAKLHTLEEKGYNPYPYRFKPDSFAADLQEKYKDKWERICPEAGKHKLLWMIGEIGEVIDIIKKNGESKALEENDLRRHLIEEMADVLMYYNDVLLCYVIRGEELKEAYTTKFEKNMERW